MRNILFLMIIFTTQFSFSQDEILKRVECYYIPWRVEPYWEYTTEEIKKHKDNTYFTSNSNMFIDSLMFWLKEENLTPPPNNKGLQIRMVIEYYVNDTLVNTILVGKPFLGSLKYDYNETNLKAPFIYSHGRAILALFLVEQHGELYRSKYEFGKFILENIPRANDW